MFRSVEEVRAHVNEQMNQMRFDVFERPPGNFSEFERRLGAYLQLQRLVEGLTPPKRPEG